MTAPLVSRSSRQDRNRLFLVKSEKKDAVTLIAEATLSHALKPFIKRSNARIAIWNKAAPERARQLLPDFAAILLRGSVAPEYYKASGGDIAATQDVLNHARVDTTELYIKGPQTRRIQRETIARSQALMLGWIVGAKSDGEDQAQRDRIALASDATVPFSHDCLNPATGTAPGSAAGRICRHFGGCLRCPGLVIPIDADHMARILQAKKELERARERIDPRRFELLYAPSLRILTENILPDFPERLREEVRTSNVDPANPSGAGVNDASVHCIRSCCRRKASTPDIGALGVVGSGLASRRPSSRRKPERLLARLGLCPCRRQPVQRSAMG
ncbi:hypothetical protein NKH61_32820 [Mesorhizobium sp. M1005]|uniref:hypothetical protein n=1 Tax=unclassified Mesorhizobium TaxID=325217 RepID=UPI00068878D3|nr:hypothetical protein [Mesorhizobium sp. L48C026A00]